MHADTQTRTNTAVLALTTVPSAARMLDAERATKEVKKSALKAIAKAETGASMKMVQDAIGADIATTKRLLRDLVKSNSVRTTGKTRATAYHPLDAAPPSSSAS
jgi:hypothetical protein